MAEIGAGMAKAHCWERVRNAVVKGNRVFTDFEVAGIPEKVPPIRLPVSGSAVVTLIDRAPRQSALDQHGRIKDPPLEHLAIPFSSGNGVIQREREVMPLVEIRIAIV